MSDFWDRMRIKQVDTAQTTVGDDICFYDVIAADFEPALPNFVGAVDAEKGTYFISEETPVAYRPIVIAHEHRCARHRKMGRTNYCVHALCEELANVPSTIDAQDYIRFRRIFFEGLVAYYEARPTTNQRFLAELTAGRDYLRQYLE